MFAFKRQAELAIRLFLAAVFLVYSLVPSAAAAQSLAYKWGEQSSTATDNSPPAAPQKLPDNAPVYYQPPEIVEPQRTGPERGQTSISHTG